MKRLLLVLALLWPVTAMGVDYESGNNLQKLCLGTGPHEPNESMFDFGSCIGYLKGVAGAAWAFGENGYTKPFGSCIPRGVIVKQLHQAWLKWASKNPETLHHSAASLVVTAFEEAWPCKR